MIIFFSGTGNTRYCSEGLAVRLGEALHELSPAELREPSRCTLPFGTDDKRVVWCFPTYSWGMPPVMANYIAKVQIGDRAANAVHYMLATCGDDTGYTDKQWRKAIADRGLVAAGAFEVIMPNTYVLMKGFDVDKPETAAGKIEKSESALDSIADAIEGGGSDILHRGRFAWIKSNIIYPWFIRHAMSPKPFRATEGCVECGICARTCPMANISMEKGMPQWGEDCAMCLRCYHSCPRHAVAYGRATGGKGQYLCHVRPIKSR